LTKTYKGNEENYPKYDNYDAININKVKDIPCDYDDCMGVPGTFIGKWNPLQFELVTVRYGNDHKNLQINGKQSFSRIIIKKIK